jgi:hypothetical protein
MSGLAGPAVVLLALILGVVALLGAVLVRREILSRGIGTFDCSLRTHTRGSEWSFGLARFQHDRLEWFRLFALGLRPTRTLLRARLTVLDHRRPTSAAVSVLEADWVLVVCSYDAHVLELAMSEMAYAGLATWLESAPPGENSTIVA